MAILLKCKMCGGDIDANEGMTIGTCQYCGSTMTLPRIDSDKKARLFNRANQYRMNCEFDKAYDVYKAIVEEEEEEAEAYWGLILSEYGVEYVEDPATKKRIPTCHRTHIQSVRSSVNYKLACQYADAENRFIYQDEAEVLDALQKKIISVSSKEEPYDVFICYKETGDDGQRTEDSVLAHEIYEELQKHGVRTFFARVSLEDKLGQDYEPFIYSALTTSKVMLMVTTNSEHCDAVWVKNEWMRYLHFMEEDADKKLIPVYKDISPYELPDEFVKFQAQDMGKVGAIQDLVYGVQKLLGKNTREVVSGMKEEERALLKSLEEENIRRRKSSAFLQKIMLSLVVILGGGFLFIVLIALSLWSTGDRYIDIGELRMYFPHIARITIPLIGMGIVSEFIAYIINLIKGIGNKNSGVLYISGVVFLTIGLIFVNINGLISKPDLWLIYMLNFIFVLVMTLLSFEGVAKKLCGLFVLLLMLVLLMFGPMILPKAEKSNKRDASVQQLEVTYEFINIRSSADKKSTQMGRVHEGDIYTIYSVQESEEYYWYEIKTSTGIHGYIASEKDEPYIKLLEME